MYAEHYPAPWDKIRFEQTKEGRPRLSEPKLEYATDHNLTHDGDWVVLAFHERQPQPSEGSPPPTKRVGVDVMARRLPKYEETVLDFVGTMDATMTDAEKRWVKAANPEARQSTHDPLTRREEKQDSSKLLLSAQDQEMLARQFDLWTYKEALTKNLGKGLGFDFENVELGFWECGEERSKRKAETAVLRVKGSTDESYRFIEIVLPSGRANMGDAPGATNQLVIAEGPLSEVERDGAQVAPAIAAKSAEKDGLLKIFTMEELIKAAQAKLEERS